MANFTWFTTFPIFFLPKHLILGEISKIFISGRVHQQFFGVFQLFQIVSHWRDSKWPTMANFALKKWLRLAENGQFWSFYRFSHFFPKMRLRLTGNGQFHLIHNFSHLLPPKHLILGEISKIVIPGGVYIGNFWEFFNFSKWFHTEVAPNDPQWWIFPKKCLRLAQNGQFWSLCSFSHFFPQNEAQIDWQWPISPDLQLFPSFYTEVTQNDLERPILPDSQLFLSFATKASHFRRNVKKFHSWEERQGYIGNDSERSISWNLQLFQSFPTKVAENDLEQPISPDSQLF